MPVGQDAERGHVVAVHVALEPVDDLLGGLALADVAVDLAAVVIEKVVDVVARIDLICIGGKRERPAEGLLHGVDDLESVRLTVGHHADLVRAVLHEIAVFGAKLQLGDKIAVLVPDAHAVEVAQIEVAFCIGEEVAGIEIAALRSAQIDRFSGLAVRADEQNEILLRAALVIVAPEIGRIALRRRGEAIAVGLNVHADAAVGRGGHVLNIHVAAPAFFTLRLHGVERVQLCAFARAEIHSDELEVVGVIRIALAGVGVKEAFRPAFDADGKIEVIAADTARVDVVHVHRQVDVLCGIGVL